MGVEKIDKRVRETSLRKFITISGQLFVIILSLCTDTGSACYDCFTTFPEGMSIIFKMNFGSLKYVTGAVCENLY